MSDLPGGLPPEVWAMITQQLPPPALGNLGATSTTMHAVAAPPLALARLRAIAEVMRQRNEILPVEWYAYILSGSQFFERPLQDRIAMLGRLLDVVDRALSLGVTIADDADRKRWTIVIDWIHSVARSINWDAGGAPIDVCGRCNQVTSRAVQIWNLTQNLVWVPPLR